MKKTTLIFLLLIMNALITILFLSGWLILGFYESVTIPLAIILLVSYLLPLSIIGILITLDKDLSRNQQLMWLAYCLLTSHVGCIHFFLKYKKDIALIIRDQDKAMRSGPDSLSEFDSRTDR